MSIQSARRADNTEQFTGLGVARQPLPPNPWQRGDDVEIGRHLVSRIGAPGDVVYAHDEVWVCSDSVWNAKPVEELRKMTQDYAGTKVFKGVNEKTQEVEYRALKLSQTRIVGAVNVAQDYCAQPSFFADAPYGAAFGGTFVRLTDSKTRAVDTTPACLQCHIEREPLTRNHRVRADHALPFELDTASEPPEVVMQLLYDTWAGCDDIPQRIRFLLEWLGLAIIGRTTHHKASPLLIGPKDTGKTRVLDVVASVFPASAIGHVPLHDMANEYHRAGLAGRRLNVVNELPARDVLISEAAKAIFSGDGVSARHPAGRPFNLVSRCAHAFACNKLPAVLDPALLGRFVVKPRVNLLRYHGQFAANAAWRDEICPQPRQPAPASVEDAPTPQARHRRFTWSELLKRCFAFDVLKCHCGGTREVLALISSGAAARRILAHLDLPTEPRKFRRAHPPPELWDEWFDDVPNDDWC